MGHRLGYQVLFAALLGIFAGIFLGPAAAIFAPVGNVYVMLLQMVALPYICFTLIHGLGSMTPEIAKKLFKRGWPFWLGLWAIIFIVIYGAAFLIPKAMPSTVGSTAFAHDSTLANNFLTYLVPENPFYDLANNIVPAIAIFGLIVGVALMHLEKKEPLLSILERANQTIEKILKWIAIFSPVGVFAHIGVASGTVYWEDLLSIEFYVLTFIAISLLMVLWVLPGLIASLTPLSYREALKAFRTVCLLPFATALPTIALPFIILYMQKLGEQHAKGDPKFHATSQTVMPFCYSFGQIGNCLILFYIFFISFYYRHPFMGAEKALLSVLTVPLSVGSSASSISAVSFLINQLNFPNEAIQLFTETMSITINFQVLLSVASVLTFIILVLYSYYDLLEIKWRKLYLHLGSVFATLLVIAVVGRGWIRLTDNYEDLYLNLQISEVIPDAVSAKVLAKGDLGTERHFSSDPAAEPLDEILRTGVLKVGYDTTNMPYCYWNGQKQLVGFDIAFAYALAKDLDCTLEFVPLDIYNMGKELDEGKYDIAMSAIIMDEERIRTMDFTHPYTEQDNVLIVPAKKRSAFVHLRAVQAKEGIRFGAAGGFIPIIERHFPKGIYVEGNEKELEFSEGKIDAWISAHTPAFAWCVSYPEYMVIEYGGLIGKRYFGYPIRAHSLDWASFLNNWLILKTQSGFEQRMYNYWIAGENPSERPPRWSVLRNVLHWIN